MQDAQRTPRALWMGSTLLALALAAPPTMAQGRMSDAQDDYLRQVQAVASTREDENAAQACRQMRRLRQEAVFATLPDDTRAEVLAEAGYVYLGCDKPADALPELQASVALKPQRWSLRNLAHAAERAEQPQEGARALIEIAGRWPQDLDDDTWRHAWRLHRGMEDAPRMQAALLQAFFDARFELRVGDGSEMWLELARLYLEAGDIERARVAASRIIGGHHVLSMRTDRRFDPIVVRDASAFDARLQAERLVEKLQRQTVARPRDVDAWVQLSYAKLVVGDHQGVIDDATRVLAAVAPTDGSTGDVSKWGNVDNHVWLINNRAIAYARMGKVDEAIAELERAAAIPMNGGPNVSQVLNLGTLYCYAGRPEDAVRSVAISQKGMSPFGQLVQGTVLLCAAAQRGDRGEVKRLARFLQRTAGDEFPLTTLGSHLWEGDVPAAERVLLRMLDDPANRIEALGYVQDYAGTENMPGRAILDRYYAELMARPAVKAAIDKVGRVEKTDLYLDFGFD